MAERKISEMSLEELKLFETQLTEKLSEVRFYLRKKQTAASQTKGKETVWSKKSLIVNIRDFFDIALFLTFSIKSGKIWQWNNVGAHDCAHLKLWLKKEDR